MMLSPTEKACLLWVSQGKSLRDIARLAGRRVEEIESHVSDACASLGAVSLAEAIEKANLPPKIPKRKRRNGTKRANPVDVEVGARIRSQRRVNGMSQEALAQSLGISFQQVQKYEKGFNRVAASRLQNLADALLVPIEFFFVGNSRRLETQNHPTANNDLTAFLQSEEGRELNAAFSNLNSSIVRKRIVDLVKAIATPLPGETSKTK